MAKLRSREKLTTGAKRTIAHGAEMQFKGHKELKSAVKELSPSKAVGALKKIGAGAKKAEKGRGKLGQLQGSAFRRHMGVGTKEGREPVLKKIKR